MKLYHASTSNNLEKTGIDPNHSPHVSISTQGYVYLGSKNYIINQYLKCARKNIYYIYEVNTDGIQLKNDLPGEQFRTTEFISPQRIKLVYIIENNPDKHPREEEYLNWYNEIKNKTSKKINWYKRATTDKNLDSSQKNNIGYKIVGFNGLYAYSIYNIKHRISLTPNSMIYNSHLGTSREYVINYFSGGTNDKDLLLTYQYNPRDVIKGDPEFKNGEIVVKEAKLIDIEELENELV